MDDLFHALAQAGGARCVAVADAESGLAAFIVVDDTTLGPAAGGVRTLRYASAAEGLADGLRLARAMTLKCSLAGLPAGGGKAVVLAQDGLDRPRAFARLGAAIEELGGLFRTAGDLGTTAADLEAMAGATRYVHTDERHLAESVARGLVRSIEACAELRGRPVAGLRVAVQGAGSIGARAARAFVEAGMEVVIADVDAARAASVAADLGARVIAPEGVLGADVDIVSPCAAGGVIDHDVAASLRAWAVCGAANNVLSARDVAAVLANRGVLFVPDILASAGAVIDGIGASVMGLDDRGPLIDRLGETAREVLAEARQSGRSTVDVAEARAWRRIVAAGGRARG
ncbi:MAG: Glu/Leu/Phe/Val dehydrogenase dimerization domain-containing protein [Minicystis sp.]